MENLLNNLLPFLSKCIAICGTIALSFWVINQKFKMLSVILGFIILAIFSYLVLHPNLIQGIGGAIYALIMEGLS